MKHVIIDKHIEYTTRSCNWIITRCVPLNFKYSQMETTTILKTIVTAGNMAKITHAIAGVLYYQVNTSDGSYQFTVDMNDREDVGTTSFDAEIKAITLMRYVRKAIKNEELIKL